jgi:hypothetical protein
VIEVMVSEIQRFNFSHIDAGVHEPIDSFRPAVHQHSVVANIEDDARAAPFVQWNRTASTD